MATQAVCKIESCGKSAVKGGYCTAHYKRLRRHGDPLGGTRMREPQPDICTAPGCDRKAVTRSLCATHYARLRKRGNTDDPAPRTPLVGRCSVEGCGREGRLTKGMCEVHRARVLRHGSATVQYRAANGERRAWIEAHTGHEGEGCLPWPFPADAYGYGQATVDGKTIGAHRYMCLLVNGPPPTPEHDATHSCGKGHERCVHPRHLRWATALENMADKVAHGTQPRGADIWNAKLTEADVRSIRRSSSITSQQALADMYGVSQSTISHVVHRTRWGWVD